jgi:hypothetical protein
VIYDSKIWIWWRIAIYTRSIFNFTQGKYQYEICMYHGSTQKILITSLVRIEIVWVIGTYMERVVDNNVKYYEQRNKRCIRSFRGTNDGCKQKMDIKSYEEINIGKQKLHMASKQTMPRQKSLQFSRSTLVIFECRQKSSTWIATNGSQWTSMRTYNDITVHLKFLVFMYFLL